jgi:hypothetical protein
MTTLYHLLLSNGSFKKWAVPQTPKRIQYLRYSIISKHGNFVNVVKFTIAFAFECCPEICHTDLSSFKKSDILPILKTDNVVETREVLSKDVDQSGSGMVGSLYAFGEAALVFLYANMST